MNTDRTYCTGGGHIYCLRCTRNIKLYQDEKGAVLTMMNPPEESTCSLFSPYVKNGVINKENI